MSLYYNIFIRILIRVLVNIWSINLLYMHLHKWRFKINIQGLPVAEHVNYDFMSIIQETSDVTYYGLEFDSVDILILLAKHKQNKEFEYTWSYRACRRIIQFIK